MVSMVFLWFIIFILVVDQKFKRLGQTYFDKNWFKLDNTKQNQTLPVISELTLIVSGMSVDWFQLQQS